MEKSNTIGELAKALVGFQIRSKTIGYDATNPFFKSKYATLTALVSETKAELANCGLAVSQLTEGEGGITTILMHTSGEYICSTLTLKAVKDDPQGHGSAITYARRYAYASILGLVSDEDDDGNAATQPRESIKQATNGNGHSGHATTTTKTVKEIIVEMGKQLFKTPDDFKLWRVDNNFPDSIKDASEFECSKILIALKDLEVKK